MDFKTDKPTVSALYLVDRGMQGKWYRWYNADKDQWGACGFNMQEAIEGKHNTATSEILGFFPWCGPLTGPNFKSGKDIVLEDDKPEAKPAKRVAKRMAKKAPVAVVPKVKHQSNQNNHILMVRYSSVLTVINGLLCMAVSKKLLDLLLKRV